MWDVRHSKVGFISMTRDQVVLYNKISPLSKHRSIHWKAAEKASSPKGKAKAKGKAKIFALSLDRAKIKEPGILTPGKILERLTQGTKTNWHREQGAHRLNAQGRQG